MPDELLADLGRVRVAVAQTGRAHDDDEVRAGARPHPLGERLERARGVPGGHRLHDVRLGRDGLRHREHPGGRLVGDRLPGLEVGGAETGRDDAEDERHDERRRLSGDAQAAPADVLVGRRPARVDTARRAHQRCSGARVNTAYTTVTIAARAETLVDGSAAPLRRTKEFTP